MPSPGYRVSPQEVSQPPAAVCCGGPSGCLPWKVQLDARWGPVTFCIWLQHRWEAPWRCPSASCLFGPFIHQLPEMERWRPMGGCAPLQASHPATMKQKTQPGRLFSCAKCTSKWHYALQHFGRQMWEEWRSILRQNLLCVFSCEEAGTRWFSRRQGIHSVSLFILLGLKTASWQDSLIVFWFLVSVASLLVLKPVPENEKENRCSQERMDW